MAYEGELVKMENGRWAKFTRCWLYSSDGSGTSLPPVLIAVELDEEAQQALEAQHGEPTEEASRMSWNPAVLAEPELSSALV
jgi:hypothetical protein